VSGAPYETYLNPRVGPLPFCPGCGHELFVRALDRALVKLQLDTANVVIVTDIGCIGLTCRHFITNAFHGLHGRSITYACGLKLARPELTVVAVMGDGACGIGGTHLLNVARRNIGITLVVANNFNYGMTGGQHSVTTPTGGKTSDTPWGNVETPMDLCATAAAAGAAWVYRATAFDKDLPEILAKAISQPGFAMIDIWELCTAYYQPKNELKKKGLFELIERLGLQLGLQVDRPRAEYTEHYSRSYEAGKSAIREKPPIVPSHQHGLERQTGIIIAGSAGQKIKSTATLLAEGGIFAGLQATQKDDYPITVKTGHSVAEIVLSPERIDYTGIDEPDYLVLLSDDGVRRIRRRFASFPASCVVYADDSLELPPTPARVRRLALRAAGRQLGPLSVATAALGAFLQDTGVYPVEALARAIREFQSPKIAETGARALSLGAALMRPPESGTES
jgi:pyruvate/2-oxoacid:ferredoxin oxidoreductase beta subunit/Pyruvate/2-oxoacid:ferredoxin oxidoreductase gamma subunit